jgi:hypothetical protein
VWDLLLMFKVSEAMARNLRCINLSKQTNAVIVYR